jgi:lipopolysaccharide transport system permease protein
MNKTFWYQQASTYIHLQKNQGGLWWLWFVVLPITPILAYTLLGFLKVLPVEDGIPRFLYIVSGMTIWMLLSDALTRPYKSIFRSSRYYVRQEISLIDLFSSWMPERFIQAVMQFVLCLVLVFVAYQFSVLSLIKFFFIVVSGFLLFFFIGVSIAVVSLMYPSLDNLVVTLNRFLLFVSGVIFPLPDNDLGQLLKQFNPYYVFIDSARLSLFERSIDWGCIFSWLLVGFFMLILIVFALPRISSDIREFLQ